EEAHSPSLFLFLRTASRKRLSPCFCLIFFPCFCKKSRFLRSTIAGHVLDLTRSSPDTILLHDASMVADAGSPMHDQET
ncbi:MAG: hypothetical protein ACRDGA_14230, partial [Bacteroidota bacterium]